MQRQKDIVASEVIGFTDETGNIAEVQVNGTHVDGTSTWILLHTSDASFRMSTAEDSNECMLTGLDVYEPTSKSLWYDWPEGLTSFKISRASFASVGTVTGTRRAIRDFVRTNWTNGSDDADEQLAAWMDLVTEQA